MLPIKVNFVNDTTKLVQLIDILSNKHDLYVDCEGDDLCRYGKLYTIQIYYTNNERLVHIVEATKIQNLFTIKSNNITLGDILTRTRLVMFDPRNDVDTLYNHYNVLPTNVICLQLAEVAYRKQTHRPTTYVNGLGRCIDNYCYESICSKERMIKRKIGEQLKKGNFDFSKFICSSDNNDEVDVVIYSCVDAVCMPELERKTYLCLSDAARLWVDNESKKRCEKAKTIITFDQIHSRSNAIPPPMIF